MLIERRRVQALRAAIGLVGHLELLWETGPEGGIFLRAFGPTETAWVERCWLAASSGHVWRPVEGPATDLPPMYPRRFGQPARSSACPFPADPDLPWADAVAPTLGVLPAGVRIRWELEPTTPPGAPTASPPSYDRQPVGFRLAALSEPEREARDRQARRRWEPWWEVRMTLEVARAPRLRGVANRLARIVAAAAAHGGDNRLEFVEPWPVLRTHPRTMFLSESEVGSLLPGPQTRLTAGREVGSSPMEPGLPLGRGDDGVVARIAVPEGEGRHLAILGETGMGKSSALVRLALEGGRHGGVVLLDPVGDTGRAFLARLPARDLARTVWISPTRSPVAVDLLASIRRDQVGDVAADRALGDVVDALRRVRQSRFSETPFWGPRIEETVRRALAAAAALPGGTLRDAERLLAAVGRPPTGVPPEAREAVMELWQRARERPEEVDGSRRLLAELTGRPALARMLGAVRPRFAPADLSTEGRIVVITAEATEIGEAAARYFLAVQLALFWSARLGATRYPKTFLLLEEAQWYAHESVAEMLRLGRRTNVHLYLATQALGALAETVADAVRTNAADFLVFRGSPDEAREFARWTAQIDPVQLLGLSRGHALLLRGKGAQVTPVVIVPVRSPPAARAHERLEEARDASRPYWPEEEAEVTGLAGPVPVVGSLTPGEDADRDLWLVIWAAFLDAGSAESLRVPLRRLRAAVDPEGSRVREAGRRLRSSGVLLSSDRDSEGAGWELQRSGVAELLGPGVGSEELAEATRRWRSTEPAQSSVGTQPS